MRPVICALIALASIVVTQPLRADTTVFENGFWFINGPVEYDDVIVGEGAIVGFNGDVVIHGDLLIENGAWCSINESLVEGNVKARYATVVDLESTLILGNVDIKRTGGPAVLGLLPSIFILRCTIEGNVKITENDVNSITVTENLIGGQLQLKRNTSTLPPTITNNTFRKHHCK